MEAEEQTGPVLTEDQSIALELAGAWWRDPGRTERPFRLDGYAGTGKTFIAERLVERMGIDPDRVLSVAPTGKAARVLARRTGWPTSTIHRALYVPIEDPRVATARTRLEAAGPEDIQSARAELAEAERQAELSFAGNGANLDSYELIVVDEAMMVDERVATDLMALEKPLMLLGDPGQLPPVKGRPGFADLEPKCVLTDVMRQGAGSDILVAADAARRGETLQTDYGGDGFQMVPPRTLTSEQYAEFDVVICGTHRVRRGFNNRVRAALGFEHNVVPAAGEKIVIKRNDYEAGLFNGQTVVVEEDGTEIDYDTAILKVRDDTGRVQAITANTLRIREHVEKRVQVHSVRGAIDVDLAYAITCHSSQGSEWPKICVVHDWPGNNQSQWIYTALTRGSEHVTLVSNDAC